MSTNSNHWPALDLESWQPTYETLHRFTQIVGKIRLKNTPWINHSWHVVLYPNARGLTTSSIPYGDRTFEIEFDFVDHQLHVTTSDPQRRSFALEPMPVAEFYRRLMGVLDELDLHTSIWTVPVEIPGEVERFEDDTAHASYDPEAVEQFWGALLQMQRVFTEFRAGYIGKVSPVHFFWGAFDLCVTRFSGRTAPKHPGGAPNCADWVMQEAYSHEVSSAGFWPGLGIGEPMFYAYAYPEPDGFAAYPVRPEAAHYNKELGEFLLSYEVVRTADDPDAMLMEFLESTYRAAAEPGNWDRSALERSLP